MISNTGLPNLVLDPVCIVLTVWCHIYHLSVLNGLNWYIILTAVIKSLTAILECIDLTIKLYCCLLNNPSSYNPHM